MALKGWHHGEQSIHKKLGVKDKVALQYKAIDGDLPSDHGRFYATCLHILPVTTLDDAGRPWGSILAGKDGKKGFVLDNRYTRLTVKAQVWDGDPFLENLKRMERDGLMLIAGIGVEFSTRRRNKFAGVITEVQRDNRSIELELIVKQAIGNCPKYINVRDLEPCPKRQPQLTHRNTNLSINDKIPEDLVNFILSSDTVFLGTYYSAKPEYAKDFPSHVGMNHRGGLAGFVRVMSDRRTMVLPDYSGNLLMTSLGNIEATPLASLTFVSFVTGDILYLTGDARNLVGEEAHSLMPFQKALTTIRTTGFIFVRDALPVRQCKETELETSPYSPPVRLLTEETSIITFDNKDVPEAVLTEINIHDVHIATFTWESSKDIHIQPGQAIILDCSSFIGSRQYQHMSPSNPASVNDDRIRTWTVSSACKGQTRSFSITLRCKPGGLVTSAFFMIAQRLRQTRPELLNDARLLNITVKIVGITGRFLLPMGLPYNDPLSPQSRDLVWFACGIGFTPFLSMLTFLRDTAISDVHIRFIHSAREPDVLLPILFNRLQSPAGMDIEATILAPANPNIHLTVDILHSQGSPAFINHPTWVQMRQYPQRLDAAFIETYRDELLKKDIYICGPDDYAKMIISTLTKIGVNADRICTESFTY